MGSHHDHACNTSLSLGLGGFEASVNINKDKKKLVSFKLDHLLSSPLSLGLPSYQKKPLSTKCSSTVSDYLYKDGYIGRRQSDNDVEEGKEASPRKKLRLTKDQSALLEDIFKNQANVNLKQKRELAKQLKLSPRQVEVWFQNRRARMKPKQTKTEFELLKKHCERLIEENKKLNKELMELKSLKLAGANTTTPSTVSVSNNTNITASS